MSRTLPSGPHRQRCDWCSEWATRITHHDRPNAGPLTAYWCEKHYAAAESPAPTPPPHPDNSV